MTAHVDTFKAIAQALRHNVTFAAYIFPNSSSQSLRFIAQLPDREPVSDTVFNIGAWNTSCDRKLEIKDTVSIEKFLSIASELPVEPYSHKLWSQSTPSDRHSAAVGQIVEALTAKGGGKVVLSRAITGSLKGDGNGRDNVAVRWAEIARQYFESLPSTFRYIFNTPVTGSWIGASPEILLKVDKATRQATTMSLAGTRPVGLHVDWDHKNLEEHDLVTRFISEQLNGLGLSFDIVRQPGVTFKSIEHLCDVINVDVRDVNPSVIIDRLNPTPALSGYPRKEAIDMLAGLEDHPRYCYGGYVAVEDGAELNAYVNLRCVNFVDCDYCMYAGGGITAFSVADDEWSETEHKIAPLRQIILNNMT